MYAHKYMNKFLTSKRCPFSESISLDVAFIKVDNEWLSKNLKNTYTI